MHKISCCVSVFVTLQLVICLLATSGSASAVPNDHDALAGFNKPGRAFFDVNIGVTPETFEASMGKLALYLDVIGQTHDSLRAQAIVPEIVVVFRGSAVMLVTKKASDAVKGLISGLAEKRVKFEACNVATTLMGTSNDSILPEIKVVGNTFISAIGYQSSGYSYILIQ